MFSHLNTQDAPLILQNRAVVTASAAIVMKPLNHLLCRTPVRIIGVPTPCPVSGAALFRGSIIPGQHYSIFAVSGRFAIAQAVNNLSFVLESRRRNREFHLLWCLWLSLPGSDGLFVQRILADVLCVVVLFGLRQTIRTENST